MASESLEDRTAVGDADEKDTLEELTKTLENELQRDHMDMKTVHEAQAALSKINMHLEKLQSSPVGRVLNKVRKRLQTNEKDVDEDLLKSISALVTKWRKIVKDEFLLQAPQRRSSRLSSANESITNDDTNIETEKSVEDTTTNVTTNTDEGETDNAVKDTNEDDEAGSLSIKRGRLSSGASFEHGDEDEEEIRSKSVALLEQSLTAGEPAILPHTTDANIHERSLEVSLCKRSVSFQLEEAVHEGHKDTSEAHYRRHVRTLVVNLKRNILLRQDFIYGRLPAKRLAKMTPDQLATVEQRLEREKLEQETIVEHFKPEEVPIETGIEKPNDND